MSASSGATSPPPLPPAMLAQRYRLERRLAQGGMAEVWLAVDIQLSRQVAVKLLKPGLASDPVVAERFRREAIAVAQLSHPNIVAVYDAVEEPVDANSTMYRQAVVMQLINGKSLRQLLDEQKRLSPDLTMHIGVCVASALDAAHLANLVHRDVKPANILITPEGRVLLTDFGIAKGLDSSDDLTSPNIMMGTAKYLSPEQVRGRRLDGRADLYSLGLVLYECLAGRVPFLGETDTDTALARLNRDPTDLARLRPTLPYGLADLIHRLLERRPDDRYSTGAEVRSELTKIIDYAKANPRVNDPTGTPPRGATPPRGTTPPRAARGNTPSHGNSSTRGQTPARGSSPVVTGRAAAPIGGYRPAPVPAKSSTPSSVPSASGRPAGQPKRSADRTPTHQPRDRTPTSPTRPRQQPNRTFDNRHMPSAIVVAVLLITALVLCVVLWRAVTADPAQGSTFDTSSTVVVGSIDITTPAANPVGSIAAISSYDPGGDGDERPELATLAVDGNPDTAWKSLCYQDRFVGGKGGVGLVVDLGAASTGTISTTIASAPYQVRLYAIDAPAIPQSMDEWGDSIAADDDTEPGTITVALPAPARYVLVLLLELGQDAGCVDNPFRGAISDITITP